MFHRGLLLFVPALLSAAPTFHRDIVPILQERCQQCHRSGEIGPMVLIEYSQVRPWAKSIKEAVVSRRMPPWFAEGGVKFRNDCSLPQAEIRTITEWVDAGAPAGDKRDAPAPKQFTDGWTIGKPDVVFEMPAAYDVPANGVIEYTDIIIPTGFTEDKWVERLEIRPGDRSVVHHVSMYVREPGVKWLRDYASGQYFVQTGRGLTGREVRPWETRMSGYAPGAPPEILPSGYGRLFTAGSDLVVEFHYTPKGKAARDRTKIGLVFSKVPVTKRVVTLNARNHDFVIPPGAASHSVNGSLTLHADSELTLLYPHMHVRGKAMDIRAVYPTGEKETLLRVPRYDFNWQIRYEPEARKVLPKGTRIEATGVFDNSANNRHNPDPKAEVRWGDQSWEEMMVGFFEVAVDRKVDIQRLMRAEPYLN